MLNILLSGIVLIVSLWFLWNHSVKKGKNLPPGPKSYPFVGGLLHLPKEVKEAKKRMQVWMKEEYGPVSSLQVMFNQVIVFVSDYELIKEVFKKQEASARPKDPAPFHELRFGDADRSVRGLLNRYAHEKKKHKTLCL